MGGGGEIHSVKLWCALTLGHGGSGLNSPTWYLMDAIFCFCAIFAAFSVFQTQKSRIIFLIAALVFAFFMQYKGINFYYFDQAPYEARYPLGRFCEVLPYAVLGMLYFWGKDKITFRVKLLIFIASAIGYFSVSHICHSPQGFGYQGLRLFFLSLCALSFFLSLPQIKNERIAYWVNFAAQFTMGIYCMHLLCGRVLGKLLKISGNIDFTHTYGFDFLIYFVCFAVSVVFWRLTYKIKFLRGLFC